MSGLPVPMVDQVVVALAVVLHRLLETADQQAAQACTMILAELGVNMHEVVRAVTVVLALLAPQVQVTVAEHTQQVAAELLSFVIIKML